MDTQRTLCGVGGVTGRKGRVTRVRNCTTLGRTVEKVENVVSGAAVDGLQ